MIRWSLLVAVVVGVLGGPAGRLGADEGMWLPVALGGELSMAHLQERGLELSRKQIWADEGPCLTDAMLQIGGLAENGRHSAGKRQWWRLFRPKLLQLNRRELHNEPDE